MTKVAVKLHSVGLINKRFELEKKWPTANEECDQLAGHRRTFKTDQFSVLFLSNYLMTENDLLKKIKIVTIGLAECPSGIVSSSSMESGSLTAVTNT